MLLVAREFSRREPRAALLLPCVARLRAAAAGAAAEEKEASYICGGGGGGGIDEFEFALLETEEQAVKALHTAFFRDFRRAADERSGASETQYMMSPDATSLLANGVLADGTRLHGVWQLPTLVSQSFQDKHCCIDKMLEKMAGFFDESRREEWMSPRGSVAPRLDGGLKLLFQRRSVVAMYGTGEVFVAGICDFIVRATGLLSLLAPDSGGLDFTTVVKWSINHHPYMEDHRAVNFVTSHPIIPPCLVDFELRMASSDWMEKGYLVPACQHCDPSANMSLEAEEVAEALAEGDGVAAPRAKRMRHAMPR